MKRLTSMVATGVTVIVTIGCCVALMSPPMVLAGNRPGTPEE
jgi:hypothetical protein